MASFNAAAADKHGVPYYGRYGTGISKLLAQACAELDGGAGAVLFPSGLAVIAGTLAALLEPGGELLMVESVYAPVRDLCEKVLRPQGIDTRFYPPEVGAGIPALIRAADPGDLLRVRPARTPSRCRTSRRSARSRRRKASRCWSTTPGPRRTSSSRSCTAPTSPSRRRPSTWSGHPATLGVAVPQSGGTCRCCSDRRRCTATRSGRRLLSRPARHAHPGGPPQAARHEGRDEGGVLDAGPSPGQARSLSAAVPGADRALWLRDFTGASGLFGVEF